MTIFNIQRVPAEYRVQVYDPKTKKFYTEWAKSRYLAERTAEAMAAKLKVVPEIHYNSWSSSENSLGINPPKID